jgi:hypothetical protein
MNTDTLAIGPEPVQTFHAYSSDPTGAVSFTDLVIKASLGETKRAIENRFAGSGPSDAWERLRWLSYPTIGRHMLYGSRGQVLGLEKIPFLLAVIDKEGS